MGAARFSKGIQSALRAPLLLPRFRAPFICFLFFRFFFWGCVCGGSGAVGWVRFFVVHFFVFYMVGCSVSSFSFPASASRLLAGASSFGFCGSRSAVPPVPVWAGVLGSLPASFSVSCGCVGGLCALARSSFPSASVFRASAFGGGRSGFARRSVALVQSVAASARPLWVSFPARPCPPAVVPSASASRCFSGGGSGSWASAALAAGLGVPVLMWLPAGVVPPASWAFVSLGGGFFFRP